MDIRPQHLPELRAEIVDSIRSSPDHSPWQELIAAGQSPFQSAPRIPSAQEHAVVDESLVRAADLFYVTAQMTQLAEAASESLPNFGIQRDDLPAQNGFIAFAEPITTVDWGTPSIPTPVVAACWGVQRIASTTCLWVKFFGDRDAWLPALARTDGMSAQEVAYNRKVISRLSLMLGSDCIGPIGARVPEASRGEAGKDLVHALRVVRASWLLMQQPLATSCEVDADRAARKRLRRGGHDSPRVRVIELRRPRNSDASGGESSREYRHQWITRGHWRQHWYPKRQVHRPVWIAPHIKGPEGAPLIGGEKVYAWKR